MSQPLGERAAGLAVAQPGADPGSDLARIAADVLERSAARALVISSDQVVVREDPDAHDKECACGAGNLMDPPFAPSPDEFRPWLAGFASALVLQVERPSDGFVQGEPGWACRLAALRRSKGEYAGLHEAWTDMHDAVMWTERELFRAGYYLSVGFGALTCTLCLNCDVGRLCKFPYRARPSIEAVGVDVGATLRSVGLPGGDTVLTGLVLAV